MSYWGISPTLTGNERTPLLPQDPAEQVPADQVPADQVPADENPADPPPGSKFYSVLNAECCKCMNIIYHN